jgi:hypothetical protein
MGKFKETDAKTIRDILTDYDQIKVPMYQRNYSWKSGDTDPVTILWNDLYDKFDTLRKHQDTSVTTPHNENGEYLLGPMVIVQNDDDPQVQIVDGQQRLATLTMIFCIARDIIYELNYTNIKSDPDFIPPQLSELIDLIENKEDAVSTGLPIFKNWNLELNEEDKKLYRQLIQEYRSPGPASNKFLDDPNDLYYKISKKIAFAEGEIKNASGSNYSDSEILLMKAYVKLYHNIEDALIVNFENNLDTEERKRDIDKKIAEQVESDFKSNPVKYKFKIDFFTDGVEGKQVLEDQNWAKEDRAKIDLELTKKNETNRKSLRTKTKNKIKKNEPGISLTELDQKTTEALKLKPSPEISFSTFITKKLKDKLAEKDVDDKTYNMKFDEHELELKNKQYSAIKTTNLVKLATFTKTCVSKHMSTVRVEVAEEEDAYEIFETLNGKGESLSQNNLIKNWIIKKIDEPERKDQSAEWDRIVKSIEKVNVDKFLMNSLKSRGFKKDVTASYIFGEFPILNSNKNIKLTTKNFYKIIKRRVQSHAEAIQYIIDLAKDASIFNSLIDPEKKFPDVGLQAKQHRRDASPAIKDMAYLEAEYIQTILITAYREWKPTSDEFIILAKFLVPFFFRYKTVSDLNVSTLETIQIVTCSLIANGAQADINSTLQTIIKYILQSDDELTFTNNLITRFEPPSEKHAKFVLHHVEHYLTPTMVSYHHDSDLELEHVLPDKPELKNPAPEKNWNDEKFFENYDYDQHKIIKKFAKWKPKLGNLTLLGNPANTYVKNFSFITKRNMIKKISGVDTEVGYNSSDLQLNKETVMKIQDSDADRDTWTAESILTRGKYLHEQCEKIWKLPEIFCTNIACTNNTRSTKIHGKIETMPYQKCPEKINGLICDHEFEIRYPNNCGNEYKVPDAYLTFAPDPPQSLCVKISNAAASPLKVVVTWDKPSDDGSGTLSGYEIFRDSESVGKVVSDTTFTDTVPNPGTFAYAVKAISNHGISVDSAVDTITVE